MTDPIAHMDGWDYLPNNLGVGDGNLRTFQFADGALSVGNTGTMAGAFGGTALKHGNNSGYTQYIGRSLAGGAVFGMRWINLPAQQGVGMSLYNSPDNTRPVQIGFGGNGAVNVTVGGVTYTSAAACFLQNTWFYFQFKWLNHFFELKINGDVVITTTAVSVLLLPFDCYIVNTDQQGTSNDKCGTDDLYILDPLISGGTDYLGNVRALLQATASAGAVTDLTPTGVSFNWQAGSNWQLLNTIYNSTPTVGNYDLYGLAASVAARQIFGIQVKGGYTQDNGTQLYGKNQIRTNATLYGGTQKGCNSGGYKLQNDYWSKNPNTGTDWTNTLLNALQAGPLLAASD